MVFHNTQRLSVCSSVCLLPTSRKNYSSDFHENFSVDVSVDKEVRVQFWKLLGSEVRTRDQNRIHFGDVCARL